MRAMNSPVFAAFAPGVLVVGKIVSAISSRYAISSGVKGAKGAPALSVRQPVISALPPIRATPPSSAATRATASRRVIISGVYSFRISLSVIGGSSDILALEFIHRVVSRAGSERHVGERGILAPGRHHARSVCHENVGRIPH